MRSTANTVLEHTLGQDVVCKRKKVVRKTKVVRREKVARTVAARRARATTTGRARFEFFWKFPAIVHEIRLYWQDRSQSRRKGLRSRVGIPVLKATPGESEPAFYRQSIFLDIFDADDGSYD